MYRPFKIILLIFVMFAYANVSFGQKRFKTKYRYTSIGVALNAMNYVGEVDPAQNFISPALKFTRPNIGFTIAKRWNSRITYRGALSWGRIEGSDRENASPTGDGTFRYARNLSFRNDIYELKADMMIDLYDNKSDMRRRVNTPYAFFGIAAFYHNPQAEYNGQWHDLQPLGTEGQNVDGLGVDGKYSLFQIAIPFGLGFRYKIGQFWDLAVEVGWRYTFTDYLDDISTNYVDRAKLGDENDMAYILSDRSLEDMKGFEALDAEFGYHTIYNGNGSNSTDGEQYINGYGATGDQRGDANKDWYIVTGFHLTYILHPRIICPKFR